MASKESTTPPNSAVPRSASGKAVDRAAKAGGGRTRAQNSTSWGYVGTLIGISVVGVALIATSFWQQREDPKAPYRQTTERSQDEFKRVSEARTKYKDKPKSAELKKAEARYEDYLTNSHIHAAYGFYDCTKDKGKEWLPPINGENDGDPKGIHAHADGLLHVHPFSKTVTGRRAVLGRWLDVTGVKVGSGSIFIPAKEASAENPALVARKAETLKSGAKCKNGKASEIRVFEYKDAVKKGVADKNVKGKRALGSAKDIPLKSGWAYVIARVDKDFVPPVPPSVDALIAPSDAVSATDDQATPPAVDPTATGSTVAGSTVAGSTVAGSTVVGAPTTKAAGAATTVPKPATTVAAPTTTK
jgi:hypothetical protein